MPTALYPGTFDPVTYGHVDIARRGAELFDKVIVAVGSRAGKEPLLPLERRVALFREAVEDLKSVTVEPFDGLLVDFARRKRATVLLRGVRNIADYEYEFQMAQTNRMLAPEVESVFLFPSMETTWLSSSLVREILAAGGSVDEFVPPGVAAALRERA